MPWADSKLLGYGHGFCNSQDPWLLQMKEKQAIMKQEEAAGGRWWLVGLVDVFGEETRG